MRGCAYLVGGSGCAAEPMAERLVERFVGRSLEEKLPSLYLMCVECWCVKTVGGTPVTSPSFETSRRVAPGSHYMLLAISQAVRSALRSLLDKAKVQRETAIILLVLDSGLGYGVVQGTDSRRLAY